MADHQVNLIMTLMGRYGGFPQIARAKGDIASLQKAFGTMASTGAADAGKQAMALEKVRLQTIKVADTAVLQQTRIKAAMDKTALAVEKSQMRLTDIQKTQTNLRERIDAGYYRNRELVAQQMADKLKLQEDRITANLAENLRARQAAVLRYNTATRSTTIANAGVISPQQIEQQARTAGTAEAGGGAGLGGALMSPYVTVPATVAAAGAYGAYKLSNYYAGFQKITQQTAANTNMSPAALVKYRAMLPGFRNQFPAPMADVNNAFFRALNLGFRTKSGAPNSKTFDFVKQVMMSALPSGANPEDVANMLGGVINAYKNNPGAPRGASPDWYMNVIHAGGAAANMNVEQMAQYFGPVSALAAASKSPNSLRQALAMVGALTQQGFTPQKASTDVAQIYQKMLHPSTTAQNMLAGIYQSTGVNLWGDFTPQGLKQKGAFGVINDLRQALANGTITRQQLLTIFPGTRGGTGLLSILSPGGQKRLAADYSRTNAGAAQGMTEEQYQMWLNTRAGQQHQASALVGQAGLYLGQGANKQITDLTSDFNKAVISVGNFVKGNKDLVRGLSDGVGAMAQFGWKISPLGGLITGLGDTFTTFDKLLHQGFVSALEFAGGKIKSALMTPFNIVGAFVKPWGGKFIGWLGAGISDHMPGLIRGPLHGIVSAFSSTLGGLASWATKLGTTIGNNLGAAAYNAIPSWARGFIGVHKNAPKQQTFNATGDNSGGGSTSYAARGTSKFGTAPGQPFYPNPLEFGVNATGYANGLNYSKLVNYEDNAGLAYAGGGPAVADYDFSVPYGTPVRLPGTSANHYTLVKQYKGGAYGWLQSWRIDNGKYKGHPFNLVHLSAVYFKQGDHAVGGTVVGKSGRPLNSSNGSGDHLAVIVDAGSAAFLKGGGSMGGSTKLPTPPPQKAPKTPSANQPDPLGAIYAAFGQSPNVGKMTPAQRSAVQGELDIYYKQQYNAAVHTINYSGADPATKAALLAAAAATYHTDLASPFANAPWATPQAKTAALTKKQIAKKHLDWELWRNRSARAVESAEYGAIGFTWSGINPKTLPATGHGMMNQKQWLLGQEKRDKLTREMRDQQAKMMFLQGSISKAAWQLVKYEDKKAQRAADTAAKRKLHPVPGGGGAAGSVVPVHIIGRCKAEEDANKHRKMAAEAARKSEQWNRDIRNHTSHLVGIAGTLKAIHNLLKHGASPHAHHGNSSHPQMVGLQLASMVGW